MGHNGYQVDLAALDEAAKGVQGAHDALTSVLPGVVSSYEPSGAAGDLLRELHLTADEFGHGNLAQAWQGFLDRRSWDLRTRLTEGQKMVQHLQDSRALYQKIEDGVTGILKNGLEILLGDPNAPDAAQRSWDQISQDIRPDWAKKSFYNGQQFVQSAQTIQGDLGSMGRDLRGTVTDPDGLGALTISGLPDVEQAKQQMHQELQGRDR